ncbi:3'-5' exonuclease [Streptomyces hainanensis]|uniref:ATP-dependent helicase n=1 Tax=Streptomyces hainanensis TaxID=402648 RepID=A0A4R4TFB4_9ACTN|nr:3'-5' exonuclease [Streptomyces hainanensis]TDC76120.1 ATP-dependent helicase [Streptomyces hainanensis]
MSPVGRAEVSANVIAFPGRPAPPADEPSDEATSVPTRNLRVPLFAGHEDCMLLDLGVIVPLLPAVRAMTRAHQHTALVERNIPELTKDVLLALYDGMTPDEVRRHITCQWQAEEPVDPQYYRGSDWESETRIVATLVKERHDWHGTPYSAMAVRVPDGAATQLALTLRREPFAIAVTELGKEGPRAAEGVRIGTMHRFKGLEFQRVFLTSVSEGQVPHQRVEAFRDTDPRRYERELQRARSLLFVAATRSRDELVITWNGGPSRFLPTSIETPLAAPRTRR